MIIYNLTNDTGYVPYHRRPETYLVPPVFFIIFIIGLLGNAILVFVFFKHKGMRSIPNFYILSLAIGDLLVILGSVPFISTVYTFESWPYGLLVCRMSEFLKDFSVGITALTLTALSIDRYKAVSGPLQLRTGSTKTILTAGLIWVVSFFLASPGAINSFLMIVPVNAYQEIKICYPYPKELGSAYPQIIISLKFCFHYAIPLIIIAVCNCLMAIILKNSESPGGKNPSQQKIMKKRTKVAKIVLALVAVFAICMFPNHVFLMWWYFSKDPTIHYNAFWHVCKIVGYILSFANSCINPLVLFFISGVFRAYYKRYLFCQKSERLPFEQSSYKTTASSKL